MGVVVTDNTDFDSAVSKHVDDVKRRIARSTEQALHVNSYWRDDTGQSKRSMTVNVSSRGWQVRSIHTYARLRNNFRTLRGSSNYHYRAVDRWIRDRWDSIVSEAGRST